MQYFRNYFCVQFNSFIARDLKHYETLNRPCHIFIIPAYKIQFTLFEVHIHSCMDIFLQKATYTARQSHNIINVFLYIYTHIIYIYMHTYICIYSWTYSCFQYGQKWDLLHCQRMHQQRRHCQWKLRIRVSVQQTSYEQYFEWGALLIKWRHLFRLTMLR